MLAIQYLAPVHEISVVFHNNYAIDRKTTQSQFNSICNKMFITTIASRPAWDNPASCSVETRVSFPMGKQLVHEADALPHLKQI